MQHDHVLKKLKFDLLTPSPGSRGGGGSAGKIEKNCELGLRFAAYYSPSSAYADPIKVDNVFCLFV